MRRLMIVALLLLPLAADARPFSTGSRWGNSLAGPGFPPMQRGAGVDAATTYPRDGLVAGFIRGNWHLNGDGIDVWYDVSTNSYNATQTATISQPTVVGGLAKFPYGWGTMRVPGGYRECYDAGTYCIVARFRYDTAHSSNSFARLWSDAAGVGGVGYASDSATLGFFGYPLTKFNDGNAAGTTLDTVAWMHIGGVARKSYVRGVVTSHPTADNLYWWTGYPNWPLGFVLGGSLSEERMEMFVSDILIYNRELTQQELDDIRSMP